MQSKPPNDLTGADSQSAALTSNETAGNLLVAVVYAYSGSSNAFAYTLSTVVTDSAGNAWFPGPVWNNWTGDSTAPTVQLWYAPNIVAGANTVTATLLPADPSPSSTQIGLSVLEYSGLATVDVVDVARAQMGQNLSSTAEYLSRQHDDIDVLRPRRGRGNGRQ